MTDNTSAGQEKSDTKPADNQNVANNTADTGNVNPDNIPYARFNEVTKSNKKLQEQLNQYEDKQEAERISKLEAEGKHQEVIAEQSAKIKAYEEKLSYHDDLEKQERNGLLSQLNETDQELYQELSTTRLRDHVAKASKGTSVRTDKSAPVRGNTLGIKHDSDIWKMDSSISKKTNNII